MAYRPVQWPNQDWRRECLPRRGYLPTQETARYYPQVFLWIEFTQVEAVLVEHPGIVSAVVIGVIDTRLGEMVVACVRLQEKWIWSDVENRKGSFQLSSETLKHHCRTQNLTG